MRACMLAGMLAGWHTGKWACQDSRDFRQAMHGNGNRSLPGNEAGIGGNRNRMAPGNQA